MSAKLCGYDLGVFGMPALIGDFNGFLAWWQLGTTYTHDNVAHLSADIPERNASLKKPKILEPSKT